MTPSCILRNEANVEAGLTLHANEEVEVSSDGRLLMLPSSQKLNSSKSKANL